MNQQQQQAVSDEVQLKLLQLEKLRESQRKANKKYRESHPEKFRNYSKKYYETNRERQKEAMRQQYLRKKQKYEIPELESNIKE